MTEGANIAQPMPGSMELPYDVSNPHFLEFQKVDVTLFPGHAGKLFVTLRSGGCTLQGTMTPEKAEEVAEALKKAAATGRSGLILPSGTVL